MKYLLLHRSDNKIIKPIKFVFRPQFPHTLIFVNDSQNFHKVIFDIEFVAIGINQKLSSNYPNSLNYSFSTKTNHHN